MARYCWPSEFHWTDARLSTASARTVDDLAFIHPIDRRSLEIFVAVFAKRGAVEVDPGRLQGDAAHFARFIARFPGVALRLPLPAVRCDPAELRPAAQFDFVRVSEEHAPAGSIYAEFEGRSTGRDQ